VFEPDAGPKEENFARARAHFQEALRQLEGLMRMNPYQWFNFTPLLPEVPNAASEMPSG
jgi:predicted LPLAT superfamily acyltransferase